MPDRSAEIAELAGILVWETDARSRIRHVEGRLRGLPWAVAGRLRGRRAEAFVVHASRAAMRGALGRGERFDDVPLAAGAGAALCASGRPVLDDEGEFAGHRGVVREVPAPAPAPASPPAHLPSSVSDGRLHTLVDALPVCIAYLDASLRYRMGNAAYLRWFATTAESLRGQHVSEVIGDRAYADARLAIECALHGETILYDESLPAPDGDVRDLQTTLVPHLGPFDEVIGLFTLFHDISDQKRRGDRLARSLGHLSAALDGLDAALVVLDARGRVRTDNASWRALRDAARPACDPGDYVRLARAIFAGDGSAEARDMIGAVVHHARGKGAPVRREVAFRAPDGTRFASVTTSEFVHGGERHVLAAHRDVTASTLLARRLQAQDTAEARSARLDSLGELAATMAHELNQPLTAIGNFAALALADAKQVSGDGTQGSRELLERLVAETRRAAEIVRRVNRSVRQLPGARTAIDPEALVTGVAERAGRRSRGIAIAVRVRGPLVVVHADAGQIEQVLNNAVSNALEAMDEAGVGTRIRIEVRPSGAQGTDDPGEETPGIVFEVSDDGPGLAPELVGRALEPFVSSKADGMGLGLAICRSIVESHGGGIRCERVHAGGTRLVFDLPGEARS